VTTSNSRSDVYGFGRVAILFRQLREQLGTIDVRYRHVDEDGAERAADDLAYGAFVHTSRSCPAPLACDTLKECREEYEGARQFLTDMCKDYPVLQEKLCPYVLKLGSICICQPEAVR
jgi:hypothetical protein